jgi:Tfp pilus assembly protein PilF
MALLQKGDRAKAKAELTAALAKNPSKGKEQKIRSALTTEAADCRMRKAIAFTPGSFTRRKLIDSRPVGITERSPAT